MGVNVVMLGPPGAGKGTQAERLATRFGVPRISTGDLLREAVAAGSPLGELVRAVMARGDLVGDALMIEVVRDRLTRPDAAPGFVLDGFPRTIPQAEALERLTAGLGALTVVELIVPEQELVRRLCSRRVCGSCGTNADPSAGADSRCGRCGGAWVQRTDDNAQVVRDRLAVFSRITRPLVDFYRSRAAYRQVDGTRPPDEVAAALAEIVGEEQR
ncbi:MAG: adenylate kinase [Acidobacteria bacterium]|nr:adenylate kinase [Acidobacteriota bacterium]